MRRFLALAALAAGGALALPSSGSPTIQWLTSYTKALARAKGEGKRLLVDVGAKWCPPCREMLAKTYTDPAVLAAAGRYIPVLVDFDKDAELTARLGVDSLPTVLLLGPDGRVIARRSGFQDAHSLVDFLAGRTSGPKGSRVRRPSRG